MINKINKFRDSIMKFANSNKQSPVLAAIASGLYPLLYYYETNFTLLNSFEQVTFFVIFFLIFPIISFSVFYFLFKKFHFNKSLKNYVLPILNLTWFVFVIVHSMFGFRFKLLAVLLLIAIAIAVLLVRHFKIIIIFQFLLAVLVIIKLIPNVYDYMKFSNDWMHQSDDIMQVKFTKKPNVYVIQPDGYTSFSELNKGAYNFNNIEFESFLTENNFKLYKESRSNYFTTLSSNSSMFTMKHHYFNKPKPDMRELFNSRNIIAGNNPVLNIFKNNNFKTNLILEYPYLLTNRPKIAYDYCNISYSEIPFFSHGFHLKKDVIIDLFNAIDNNKEFNNFYFVQKMKPSHINTRESASLGKEKERERYLDNLQEANEWLKEIITGIIKKDKNSVIVMVSDHGGFVGMDYTRQCLTKKIDEDFIHSIFSTALAIKWSNKVPSFDEKLKTNINLFRILFSYLSDNEKYLNDLQEDRSYLIIENDAPFGVYETIDEEGSIVFNKLER